MITFEEASCRVDGRLQGVMDAGNEGAVADAAVTCAGTDVLGRELVVQLAGYADNVVKDLIRETHGLELPENVIEPIGELLTRFTYRHANGTGLSFFWLGYEMGRSSSDVDRLEATMLRNGVNAIRRLIQPTDRYVSARVLLDLVDKIVRGEL